MTLDPVAALTLHGGFVLLFGAALLHKLSAPGIFAATVGTYLRGPGLDHAAIRWPLMLVLPVWELVIVALCLGRIAMLTVDTPVAGPATVTLVAEAGPITAMLACSLLLGYAGMMALNLARGHAVTDCGCHWGESRRPVDRSLVVRNLFLAAAALLLAAPVAPRPLGFIDHFSVLVAVLMLALFHDLFTRLTRPVTPLRSMAP